MSTSQSPSGSANVRSSKIWIFRILTIAGAGLMLVSWFLPWWSADIDAIMPDAVAIRPWGLESHLGPDMAKMVEKAQMPAFFAPFMWAYLGLCMLALLISLFAPARQLGLGKFKLSLPQVLVGGVGLSYVVAVVVAVIYASMRTPEFWGVNFLGYTFVNLGEPYVSGVTASLLPGYWLACVVGPFLGVLALLRNRIIGNKKT